MVSITEQRDFYDRFWFSPKVYAKKLVSPFYVTEAAIRRRVLLDLMDAVVPYPSTLLDIGCGNAALTHKLARYGAVTGLELSERAVQHNQKLYPHIKFISGDLLASEFEESSFDVVVCSEVLEHLEIDSRQRCVEIVDRVLKPSGHLFLTTPNRQIALKLRSRGDQMIENWFSIDELKELVEPIFETVQIQTAGFFPQNRPLSILFRLLKPAYFRYDASRRNTDQGKYIILHARR